MRSPLSEFAGPRSLRPQRPQCAPMSRSIREQLLPQAASPSSVDVYNCGLEYRHLGTSVIEQYDGSEQVRISAEDPEQCLGETYHNRACNLSSIIGVSKLCN